MVCGQTRSSSTVEVDLLFEIKSFLSFFLVRCSLFVENVIFLISNALSEGGWSGFNRSVEDLRYTFCCSSSPLCLRKNRNNERVG